MLAGDGSSEFWWVTSLVGPRRPRRADMIVLRFTRPLQALRSREAMMDSDAKSQNRKDRKIFFLAVRGPMRVAQRGRRAPRTSPVELSAEAATEMATASKYADRDENTRNAQQKRQHIQFPASHRSTHQIINPKPALRLLLEMPRPLNAMPPLQPRSGAAHQSAMQNTSTSSVAEGGDHSRWHLQ